ncbi:MAG: TonB family protein, partial [Myxococcaceae bacterium]|nr:TonB family protein [Myxococcaceae bacterium]
MRRAFTAVLLVLATTPIAAFAEGSREAAIVPPELIRDSPAPYPVTLAEEGLAGSVNLQLLVDEAGEVAEARVVRASDPRFVETALHAATRLLFTPARQDGSPIAVRIFFTYRFEAPVPASPVDAAVAILRGRVRTRGSRVAVPGADVRIAGEHRAETDHEGRFTLTLPPGHVTLEVRARGHEPQSFNEDLRAGETLDVVYSLMPETIDPYQTIVRSDRERTEVSRIALERAEVHDVPGTMGDPFRVVMLLPGVSALASGVAYPVVRGSQPASTGYFIDGIRVPILFHLFLGPAVVQPAFVDGIDFFPGVAPPEYGRLLGGAIDGRIARAHDDRVHLDAYADVLNLGAMLELPVESTGTSITLAGRISYTPWLVALAGNLVLREFIGTFVLDFWDYQARIEQKLGEGRRLRLLVFGSNDSFGLRNGVGGLTAMESILFHRADLRYSQPLGRGELAAGITWGLDRSNTLSAQQ